MKKTKERKSGVTNRADAEAEEAAKELNRTIEYLKRRIDYHRGYTAGYIDATLNKTKIRQEVENYRRRK